MTDQELNEAVARKLGRTPCGCLVFHLPMAECDSKPHVPDYCHSIQAAWEIVEKCDYFCLVKPLDNEKWKCDLGTKDEIVVSWADTAPRAICEAFLKLKEK